MACFSPIVNTRGAIFVDKEGIVKRTTFYVLWMYANLLAPYVIPVEASFTALHHAGRQTPVLDAVVTTDARRSRYVCAVVNKHPEEVQALQIDFKAMGMKQTRQLRATILNGGSPDDYNDRGRMNVIPQEQTLRVSDGVVSLPPHSLTFFVIE